ncbi:MAG: methyl-accepting chemotaxis protein [Candidatus Thiodiazotropha taylori]|nr:methyl-accepting chemotaxis protein [Candidatus Thiodiazotropha taylori]
MTIKNKFIVITLTIITLLIIQSGFIIYELKQLELLNQSQEIATKIQVDMLQLRRDEKDFLARKDMKYSEKFAAHLKQLDGDFSQLEENLTQLSLDKSKVISIHQASNRYGETFDNIVGLQNRIGLSSKTGLYGELRKAVHNAESLFKEHMNFELMANMLMLRRAEKDFMLRRQAKYMDKFDKSFAAINETLARTFLPGEANSEAEKFLNDYRAKFNTLFKAEQELGLTHKEGLLGSLRKTVHIIESDLENLTVKLKSEIVSAQESTQNILLISVILVSLVILILIALLGFNIVNRLTGINKLMREIAIGEGDLTQRLKQSGNDEIDELSKSFNLFVGKIHDAMLHVAQKIAKLGVTGTHVEEAATSTDSSMNELRSNTQSVVVASEQLSSTAKNVADSASHVSGATNEADNVAKDGYAIVESAVESIRSFANEFNEAATSIGKLRSETENIDNILDVIRSIADQTNLLALNAAIEAARAGESGRGFAVVADEVRMLAQRSQESTNEIQTIIEQLQQQSESAFTMISSGQERVSDTVNQAELAGSSLTKITESVGTISEMTVQIATAAEEQSVVVNDINQNIVSIDQLAHDTDNQARLTMDASAELSEALASIVREIQNFKFENDPIQGLNR